jgi:hypothetical protein
LSHANGRWRDSHDAKFSRRTRSPRFDSGLFSFRLLMTAIFSRMPVERVAVRLRPSRKSQINSRAPSDGLKDKSRFGFVATMIVKPFCISFRVHQSTG